MSKKKSYKKTITPMPKKAYTKTVEPLLRANKTIKPLKRMTKTITEPRIRLIAKPIPSKKGVARPSHKKKK